MNFVIVGILFLLQMFLILAFGIATQRIVKQKIDSPLICWVLGGFYMFTIFGVIAIVATLSQVPLSVLTIIWIVLCVVVLGYSIIFGRSTLKKYAIDIINVFKSKNIAFFVMLVVVLIQMWVVFVYIDKSPDGAYYIGSVSTNVYTNTLGKFDPYTGVLLQEFNPRYVFACFQNYNSVMAQFFNIHPLWQAKIIMPEIIIVLVNMVYYLMGSRLFKNDGKKACLLVIFMFIFNWFSTTNFTSSTFLFTRTYEGKAILGNLVVMGMIYCFINLWNDVDVVLSKIMLLGIGISSIMFSTSSIYMVPIGMTAGFLTWIIKNKRFRDMKWYLGFILPNLLVAGVYILASKDVIKFIIR